MEYTVYSLLEDLCWMSGMLFMAKVLRSKIKWFQNHYIPSSVIAGLMGLVLGPQMAGGVEWSSQAGSYPYLLTCILFAGIFLGKTEKIKVKTIFGKVGDTFFINTASEILCFGIALFLGGTLVMVLFPDIFPQISLLLPAGFAGGHGYAAAIGGALNQQLNRDDAVYIGQVFATIGLLTGLLGGIVCINIAAKKGATRFVKEAAKLPRECRTGLIPREKRSSIGSETVHPMSMDPLAWHVSLILMATGIGYAAEQILDKVFPELEFPLMCLTMLAGMLVQFVLNRTKYSEYVDKKIIDRCGSCITDYLVAFGVATIKLSVVAQFWKPIIVLCIIGVVWPLIIVFVVGKRLFHNFWFERSIFIFGYLTGIVAVGITLLRCVDPDMKSETLDDFGLGYTLQSVIEVFLVAVIPGIAVGFGCLPSGIMLCVVGTAMLLICGKLYGTYKTPMNELRKGEIEKMQ